MLIKSNQAIRDAIRGVRETVLSGAPGGNAFDGVPDVSNVAGDTSGLNPKKVQGVMESINNAIIKGDNDSLKAAVKRSGAYQEMLQGIDPIPVIRYSNAKAFADNT